MIVAVWLLLFAIDADADADVAAAAAAILFVLLCVLFCKWLIQIEFLLHRNKFSTQIIIIIHIITNNIECAIT